MNSPAATPRLLGVEACRQAVFPDPASAPGKRTWAEWVRRRYVPVVRVGKRIFIDPDQARSALERRFTIAAD